MSFTFPNVPEAEEIYDTLLGAVISTLNLKKVVGPLNMLFPPSITFTKR